MNEQIFALDIGTRTVTGILLEKEGKDYSVAACHTEEHEERAMLDGQIHDVLQVAEIVNRVKQTLENGEGSLKKVYAAAAGRSLKTKRASASLPLKNALSNAAMITDLEFSAIFQAQQALVEEDGAQLGYYCVGYSIVEYRLDGERIGSLIDQVGNIAEAEVIATFLPKVVVESLLAALERADLELAALTLEPIAAIRVLVPESMRRLNVALVDIGAGTSDIAITEDGTVSAYGMVPIAGDEITERISDAYLLDYPLAEEMKRSISAHGEATVADILGFETTVELDEFMKTIAPASEHLADAITKEILSLNGEPPRAVMMIGGGSLTPGLPALVAEKLNLPENRVAVRSVSAIQNLRNADKLTDGPDFVTPVGIAIAGEEKPVHYITVHVNDKPVRMFEMRDLTVGDCLVQAGIELGKFYGKPGEGKIITVNGKPRTVAGSLGRAPRLLLNGKQVTSSAIIQNGDYIEIRQGQNGENAKHMLKEVINNTDGLDLIVNGEQTHIKQELMINGRPAQPEDILQDGDAITFNHVRTIGDLKKFMGELEAEVSSSVTVFVNDQMVQLSNGKGRQYLLNDRAAQNSDIVQIGDRIDVINAEGFYDKDTTSVLDVLQALGHEPWRELDIFFDGKPVHLKEQKVEIRREEDLLAFEERVYHEDELKLTKKIETPFIFQDVFRYVDVDLTKASGRFELTINNEKAAFDSPVQAGDQLAINWIVSE
ncbi:pilus assembly protein PilM [Aciduricibacillus chroicocephali]|uniref:Pilus assembly protein PilM n=1 Tax=Aciduricibacillus chroicocephali TaxID=3054939 RepID=A0ABY9KSC7_9BACI|nr:pilus assembly protein PilM [Bacillaceae bacterium 44XB]